jgi:hypothetical protein
MFSSWVTCFGASDQHFQTAMLNIMHKLCINQALKLTLFTALHYTENWH